MHHTAADVKPRGSSRALQGGRAPTCRFVSTTMRTPTTLATPTSIRVLYVYLHRLCMHATRDPPLSMPCHGLYELQIRKTEDGLFPPPASLARPRAAPAARGPPTPVPASNRIVPRVTEFPQTRTRKHLPPRSSVLFYFSRAALPLSSSPPLPSTSSSTTAATGPATHMTCAHATPTGRATTATSVSLLGKNSSGAGWGVSMGEGVREIGETVRHGACTRSLVALPVGPVQGRSGESPPFPPPPARKSRETGCRARVSE